MNEFLTKGIKIHTDSMGCMTAEHNIQGMLIDSSYYETRAECRREAVKILKDIKVEKEYREFERSDNEAN